MPGIPYEPPSVQADAFNCPHCHAYANQLWSHLWVSWGNEGIQSRDGFSLGMCTRCDEITIWADDGGLIYPDSSHAPPAHEDLPEAVARDYAEAASVLSRSPRAAAALLRLAVEKLCAYLGQTGDLNAGIKNLVVEGLNPRVQMALDVVRVTGNNAVHPGQMDLTDDVPRALALFGLVNEITEAMIASPRRLEELYGSLPEGAREAIERRDSTKAE